MFKSRALIHQTLSSLSAGTRHASKYFVVTGSTPHERLQKSKEIVDNSKKNSRYEILEQPDKVAVVLDLAPHKIISDEEVAAQYIQRKTRGVKLDSSFDGQDHQITRGVIDLDEQEPAPALPSFRR